MLASLLGIRLVLLLGRTVPLPAPYLVTTSLAKVEVVNDSDNGDGFQLTFTLSKDKLGDYQLLTSGLLNSPNRVVVGIIMGASPEVLIDGIITHQQLTPSETPGMSMLVVTGKDVSQMMDLQEKNEQFPNQPDFIIATRIIGQYAQYGLLPTVTPTTDVPIMLQRVPRQSETDLRFVRRMASRNGFVFYVEPVTLGVNKAYFGPENRLSLPQPALTQNMGVSSNLKSLRFANDALRPVGTRSTVIEPISRTSIPIPSLPSLRIPPLSASPATALRTVVLRDSANQNPAQAATSAIARATAAPDAVTGEGELDAVRYGRVLRARRLVGVRGAGLSYDGFYYVKKVTHTIVIGEYSQKFVLSREGVGASTPVVIP